MKKFWFTLSLAVIAILLLLQTRFKDFLQLDTEGYAIISNTVNSTLLTDPEEVIEDDIIELYSYEPLDYIYSRTGSYYMGEQKKTKIDLTFPLYINGGAGLLFVDNNGTLFDVDYETSDVYPGLYTTASNTYNPGGEKADGINFVFYGNGTGFFYNLMPIQFEDKGTLREVNTNSAIYFTEDYFTYCELEGDTLHYQAARNMADDSKVTINDEEITYHDLLVRLGVISDKEPRDSKESSDIEEDENAVPTPEINEQTAEEEEAEELPDEENEEKQKNKKDKSAREGGKASQGGAGSSSGGAGSKKERSANSSSSGKNMSSADTTSKGVRPDSMRPDKKKGEKKQPILDYEKPVVEYNSSSAGVYRIMLDMTVEDPAKRIDKDRKVQYEFYEIQEDGTEKLVYRTYSGSSGTVTAGNGNIKPDTEYRVNIFFTYKNEYDEKITESVKSDIYIKTKPFEADKAKVTIRKEIDTDTGIVYGTIPYFYDNYMEITNFTYKLDENDIQNSEEYIYGINTRAGIVLTIRKSGISTPIKMECDNAVISKFKSGILQDLDSLHNLDANSSYEYEITMKDYFGNNITVINNSGTFDTCKSRPIGKIEQTKNVIGDVSFKLGLIDPDNSAINSINAVSSDDYDLYFVLSTEDINKVGKDKIWNEVNRYINNGNSRVYGGTDAAGNPVAEGVVHYLYKISKDEYITDGALGFENLNLNGINTVDLNTKYYVYILGDFDLNNKKGHVYHESVAEYEFKSVGLSSLGSIYVNTTIAGITAHGANIVYELNETKTNDVLTRLLSDIEFDIDTTNGSEPSTDSKIVFDSEAMKIFTGYYLDENGVVQVYERPIIPETGQPLKHISMDGTYFDKSKADSSVDNCPYYLKSMTDYQITPKIYAMYNGKKYEMNVVLTKPNFKTMREPANVDIKNVVLAGGTLRFDVHIADPDEAITGISSKMVIMNLYDESNHFVKAIRYQKNQYDDNGNPVYVSEEITGLDSNKRYYMQFRAPDYNEGYDNTTYVSNKLLLEYHIDDIIDIKGILKLHGLDTISQDSSKLTANMYVDIEDNAHIMTGASSPYYIKIEKDGVDVTDSYPNTVFGDYTVNNYHITDTKRYVVDKGRHTYKATLYIYYNNKELILDTLSFDSSDAVIPIATAKEFYDKIKEDANRTDNGSGVATGRYCITNNINLGNSNGIPMDETLDPDSGDVITYDSTRKPVAIATTFNGEIDFQGYTLYFDKATNSDGWFINLGPKGDIYNLVLECESSTTARIYDQGLICDRNYGHIHDIFIHYKGGNALDNEYYGLVTRYNTVSGIIENFVIHSDDQEDYMPFTAYQHAGLVCSENQGIVRYGYVYGSDINTARGKSTESLSVGGIVGENARAGQVYDVYSSVNIILDNDINHTNYGSVVGQGNGQLRNMYNTGIPTLLNGDKKDARGENIIGTVTWGNKAVFRDVCYWNEDNTEFVKATYQKRISLENLNDYAWQRSILESHFNVQPVEVGYYPHVIWSTSEMPQQEYIPLPKRTSTRLVELLSSELVSYSTDGNSAEMIFRFSNTRNAIINELEVEDLTVTLDQDSAVTEDGFTTMRGTVSDPQKYRSKYEVNNIKISLNGSNQNIRYDGVTYIKPIINVDFYRLIHNAEEWYEYVVCAPTENARLANDIDFSGVLPAKIQVTEAYTGKLDSLLVDGHTYGYSLKNIHFNTNDKVKDYVYVFRTVNGSISNVCVDNMTLEVANKSYTGFIMDLYGTVDNVHMKDVTIVGSDYVAPVINRMQAGSFLQNSSVTGLSIEYTERTNVNTTAYVGGLTSYMTGAKILNCYAADINIHVNDVKSAEGIGGIAGRVSYGLVENVYATGDIVGRSQNVGGIVGFYESDAVTCDVKNAITKVNVTSYQDAVGGMIGQLKLTNALINPRNNLSGVAFGNVTCSNSTSENVSYTIGYMSGSDGAMYGADFQLINGLPGQHIDKTTGKLTDHTHGLISYEQATTPATYTDSVYLNMDGVFDYSCVEQEFLPKLYYAESNILLPFQQDIRITDLKRSDDLLSISNVTVRETSELIYLTVKGPKGYKITGLEIEDLNFYELNSTDHETDLVIPDNGELLLGVYYYPEDQQNHFKDQYFVTKMDYVATDGTTIGSSTFNDTPVAIPLMMFGEIKDISTWNHYLGAENNNGNYENYRVVADIDFGTGANYAKNVKVGRLRGVGNGSETVTLKNINLTGEYTNLLFRVNSELTNFTFDTCNVNTTKREGYGLVATSCGLVKNLIFNDIKVAAPGNYAGLIAWQYGGSVQDIRMNNIVINTGRTKTINYIGGLIGYSNYGTLIKNVKAKDISVYGRGYIGGIVAYIVGSLEDIEVEDAIVTGCYYRVGGIAGCNASARQTNGNSAYINNLTIKGTPIAWDENGRVTDSTTVIAIDPSQAHSTESYDVGGAIGYSGVYINGFAQNTSIGNITGFDDSKAKPVIVDGVVVKGYGNYIGGAFGRCVDVACTKVVDTTISVSKTPSSIYNYMGAVSGYVTYNVYGCEVENCKVEANNHGRSGILTGYNGSTVQYNYVEESELYATSDKIELVSYFGGMCGYSSGAVNYSFAKNIVVDTEKSNMRYTGGLVGFMNNQIVGCGVYCQPIDESSSPTAMDKYYVHGNDYVGGIAGQQNSNTMLNNYSNINVIGAKYAGGITGKYENDYTSTVVNGKPKKSYSSVSFRGDYFAGTVTADDYAGGLIGSLGTVEDNHLTAGREKSVSGSDNEAAYTYRNLMVAEYIKANHAYAFAGNLDGFEGKANYTGLSNSDVDDAARKVQYAHYTMYWELSKVNDAALKDMTSSTAPDYAKNTNANLGGKRYATYAGKYTVASGVTPNFSGNSANTSYGQYNQDDGNDRANWNVRLVSTNNMECSNMYWSLYWNNRTKSNNTYMNGYMAMNSFRWTLLTEDVPTSKLVAPYTSYCAASGISYLPQTRNATDTTTINGFNAKIQTAKGMNMPVPVGYPSRAPLMMMSRALFVRPADNYGILYASDVDRINLEFGQDLVDNGYFVLKAGGKVIDRQIIRQRVYTYNYDQSANLELCYGSADLNSYMQDNYDFSKGEYIEGRKEEGIFDAPDMYLEELGDDTTKVASLRHHIMTYGTKYYYISDEGLVEGFGSYDPEENVDTSATVTAGKYLSVYNGHVLSDEGNIMDVSSKETIRTMQPGIYCLNNPLDKNYNPDTAQTVALQHFTFNDTYTTVYHKYTDYEGVGNSGQFMMSAGKDVVLIDKELDNIKDAVTFYNRDDESYCTIVDKEGFIQDLYRGGGTSGINAPSDMRTSGVVYASNNLNCTAPFILVEYSNGGIVGFNYMTGEYLFDASVSNVMDLTDYARVYLEGDKPEKSYADYAANAKLAKIVQTADRLSAMVKGENSGVPVDDINYKGNTAYDPDSMKSVAEGDGTLAGDNTALREKSDSVANDADDTDDTSLDYSITEEELVEHDGKDQGNTILGDSNANGSSMADGEGGSEGEGGTNGTSNEEYTEGLSGINSGFNMVSAGIDAILNRDFISEAGVKAGKKAVADEDIDVEDADSVSEVSGAGNSDGNTSDKNEKSAEKDDLNDESAEKDNLSVASGEKDSLTGEASEKEDLKDEADEKNSTGKKGEAKDGEDDTNSVDNGSNMDNGMDIKTIEEIDMTSTDTVNEPENIANSVETKQTLIAVYNASTGEYEIVDMTRYMSDPTYMSENSRLAIKDLSVYSDYHAEKTETKKENGLWMYILSSIAVVAGIGGGIYFKKKHKLKV